MFLCLVSYKEMILILLECENNVNLSRIFGSAQMKLKMINRPNCTSKLVYVVFPLLYSFFDGLLSELQSHNGITNNTLIFILLNTSSLSLVFLNKIHDKSRYSIPMKSLHCHHRQQQQQFSKINAMHK